jgi:hypothetical protein
MDPRLEPGPPDLTLDLSSDTCWQVIHTLRAALPLIGDTPGDAGSTPSQALARRDNAAIARVACLLPANADEAEIATQYIAAGAQAMDCMRLAREHHGEPAIIFRCTALAATMLRQARAMRSLLQRVQAERRKRAAQSPQACRAHPRLGPPPRQGRLRGASARGRQADRHRHQPDPAVTRSTRPSGASRRGLNNSHPHAAARGSLRSRPSWHPAFAVAPASLPLSLPGSVSRAPHIETPMRRDPRCTGDVSLRGAMATRVDPSLRYRAQSGFSRRIPWAPS